MTGAGSACAGAVGAFPESECSVPVDAALPGDGSVEAEAAVAVLDCSPRCCDEEVDDDESDNDTGLISAPVLPAAAVA